MTAPTYPDRPEWLTDDEWQLVLKSVRQNYRIDGATLPIGLISAAETGAPCKISPEEVWWEAWQIAVIKVGSRVAPPPRVEKNRGHDGEGVKRKRGPKPKVFDKVLAEMREVGFGTVKDWTEVAMEAQFNASRDVCRKARDRLESELVGKANPDK